MKATWQQVEQYVKAVKDRYKDKQLSGVYGIPRGGLVLAVMVSHALNIPLVSYPKYNALIVDDISDTGNTLAFYVQSGYETTTMFYHKSTVAMPNYTLFEKTDEWIEFPWEID